MLHSLNQLLKSNAQWKWSTECQKTFEQVKSQSASAPILAHYDVTQKIKFAVDSSTNGLGAVISHTYEDGSERLIAYASCILSDAEKNYEQIGKEALALVFAAQKFHSYLYGSNFILVTDHNLLISLLRPKKAIPQLAAA